MHPDLATSTDRRAPDTVAHEAELARLDRLAVLLDSRFSLLGFRFGLDSVIGLVPGIGDTVMLAPSAWMIWKAHRLGAPKSKLARMAANTGIDYVVGAIPLIGDLIDFGFKANLRNAAILREHLEGQAPPRDVTPRS